MHRKEAPPGYTDQQCPGLVPRASGQDTRPRRQPADTVTSLRIALRHFSSSHCKVRAFERPGPQQHTTDPHRGLEQLALCILYIVVESGIELPLTLPRCHQLPPEAAEA